jgi:CheY-like chemotaxis protein
MMRVHLILRSAAEREKRAVLLRQAGYEVSLEPETGPELLRALSLRPPNAVVIDLGWTPSHGRDIALALRARKATRLIPLVFVGGQNEKVEQVSGLLPDAQFTDWGRIRSALKHAIVHPLDKPVVPRSVMAGYSGAPLVKKLGIKAGMTVALIHAPTGFSRTVGELPEGVELGQNAQGRCGLALWFVRSEREFSRDMRRIAALGARCPVWIAWQKKKVAGRLPPAADRSQRRVGSLRDVGEKQVRAAGLAAGLVDYKVCSIDDTWSGLLFARRKNRQRSAARSAVLPRADAPGEG